MPCLPSPSHHHFYRWYVYHSQSWVVYGIVLPALLSSYVQPTRLASKLGDSIGVNGSDVDETVREMVVQGPKDPGHAVWNQQNEGFWGEKRPWSSHWIGIVLKSHWKTDGVNLSFWVSQRIPVNSQTQQHGYQASCDDTKKLFMVSWWHHTNPHNDIPISAIEQWWI